MKDHEILFFNSIICLSIIKNYILLIFIYFYTIIMHIMVF